MEKEHHTVDTAGSPHTDSEKGPARRPSAGHDGVPQNFREEDFMTRNGLNLRSFQRRECSHSASVKSEY